MLLSPRPTTILPSSAMGEYTAINKVERVPYIPRTDANGVPSPRQPVTEPLNTSGSKSIVENPRRPPPKRSASDPRSSPELPHADTTSPMRSRGSSSSMQRTVSSHSNSSMKRSMSKELSTPTKKAPKQFVVRSKASRLIHRPSSSTNLARTPSSSRLAQGGLLPLTQTTPPKRERRLTVDASQSSVRPAVPAGQGMRQQVPSMTQVGNIVSPPLIRRTVSDGNAVRLRRSSSETSQPSPLTRPRRSSNLAREANVDLRPAVGYSSDSDDEAEDGDDHVVIQVRRRPLLEEPELSIPVRRITERSPPTPPTLQLRRPSQSQNTSPRIAPVVSGLSALSNNNLPPFCQLMQPGAATVAPPSVTTTSAVVKDLPYVPHTVGSHSSVKERINLLQNGRLPEEFPSQAQTTSSSSGDTMTSPVDERTSIATTTGSKPISLENTRYALSPEAHMMIRRLSNGPPGMARRPSSPSPPAMPSGWVRPERPTRTMQRQVMYRDLEQAALEQQHAILSPLARSDSRSDYFNPSMNQLATGTFEDDPFLNTLPQLNRELRRIENELNNVKKFNDPMADALKRLHERSGENSPILAPSKSSTSMFSLSSSLIRQLSPERRGSATEALRKNSLPSRLRESTSCDVDEEREDHRDGGVKVFAGENESRLREVTRQLWFSRPETPNTNQESEEKESEDQERVIASTSTSPAEMRANPIPPAAERRSFGSGLRQTFGSALALAGLRQS